MSTPAESPVRGVRVFVSSTFRDMAAERDELVKRVFPALRHRCEERGATWSEVDLRWGVTDEQAAEGDVLPICLREIELSRPFFIGLLGERYGWIPPELPEDLVRQHTWLAPLQGRSVTELEMLYGVLEDAAREGDAFFYLRDPAWLDQVPDADRADYVDDHPDARALLAALKERVRSSGLPVRVYESPTHLAELVAADFASVIDRRFPEGDSLDPLDSETREHAAYAATRFDVWVGRDADLDRLDALAADPSSPPLVVSGPSGTGKSALVANWLRRLTTREPERQIVAHYAGASPQSAEWPALATHVIQSLDRALSLGITPPKDPAQLPDALARTLATAGARATHPVVVVLDGLDQVVIPRGHLPLHWLPDASPPGVVLVVTAKPSPALDELTERRWARHDLDALPADHVRTLARRYLATYAKALSDAQLDRICAAPQASNALFLLVLLDELRHHGDHFTLDAAINRLLSAATIDDLFESVLGRWEQDYERATPDLVRRAFTLLRAGRRGLEESELLRLLGEGDAPLPRAHWSPLFLAAERTLILRDGRLTLAHDYLRQAVDDRYLAGAPTRDGLPRRGSPLCAVHDQLADFFADAPLSPRVLAEYPWQLVGAHRWRELRDWLVREDVALLSWDQDETLLSLRRLWALLEEHSDHRMATELPALPPTTSHRHRGIAAGLLQLAGHYEATLALQRSLRQTADTPRDVAVCLATCGAVLAVLARDEESRAALDEAEPIARALNDLDLLGYVLRTRSQLAARENAWASALAYLADAIALHREDGDLSSVQRLLEDRAHVLMQMEDLDAAMEALDAQRAIVEELADPVARAANAGSRAKVETHRGRFADAVALHREEAAIYREVGDRTNVARALGSAAYCLEMLGDREEARALLAESDAICEAARLTGQRANNRYALARLLRSAGDIPGALAATDELLALADELDDDMGREQGIGLRGDLLRQTGNLVGARAAHEQQLALARANERPRGIALALLALGEDLLLAGDLPNADMLLADAEARLRQMGDSSNLQVVLGVRARLQIRQGEPTLALATLQDQLAHARTAQVVAGELNALGNLTYVRASMLGDIPGALEALAAQEELARRVDQPVFLADALWNQGALQAHLGNAEASDAQYAASLDLMRHRGLYHQLRDRLTTLAVATYQAGDAATALAYTEEGLAVSAQRLGQPSPPPMRANRGELLVATGRKDEGYAELEQAALDAEAMGDPGFAAQVRQLAAQVRARYGG